MGTQTTADLNLARAVRRRFGQVGLMVLTQAVALFASSGRLDWGAAWLYLAIYLAFIACNAVLMLPRGAALVAERSEIRPGAKRWDMLLGGLTILFGPVMLIVAGFDERFGWTPLVSWRQLLAGTALTVLGDVLFGWAMASNPFFSSIVRIQAERGHTVATGGPYRWVRHPAYAGMLLNAIGLPLLLGAPAAFLPGLGLVAGTVARTALEDRTLQAELGGYREYASRTRYRLVPGIW